MRHVFIGMLAVALSGGAAQAQAGDAAKGKAQFLQCAACHSVVRGQPHKVGPNLTGIAGAKAGTRPGYNYSPAMKASGVTWTDKQLDAFIQKPAGVVPKNKMVFGGIADPAKRANLIAYLKALK